MPRSRTDTARGPLSRDRVVAAAVALADAEGIDALSMRRLAAAVGVEAMSLYNHVANKDDLLAGMIDAVFAEIELPAPASTDWQQAMGDRARSLRTVLLRHRWAIGLLDTQRTPGPATLRHHDAVIGVSRRAGHSVEMAAHAFSLIDSYVYGFVLQEVTLPFDDSDGNGLDPEAAAAVLGQVDPAEHPHLAELTAEHVARAGYSFASEFEFGLALVLDALEAAAGSPES